MATPAELRKLTEQGKQKKQEREAEERKVAEQKAHEAAREKAYKEVLESQRIIDNVSYLLKSAADNGFSTARIYTIPSGELQFHNPYQTKIRGKEQKDYNLTGIAKKVYEHFKKEGFDLAIEEQAGPYDPEGPTAETYHIRVGW